MKVLVYFLLLTANYLFAQKMIIDNDSVLEWDNKRKLVWSDFKANVNPIKNTDAATAYSIRLIPEVLTKYDYENISVVTVFNKKRSFISTKSESLLRHEQLHFDIAEFYSRKIRKSFSKLRKMQIINLQDYIKIYKDLEKKCFYEQEKYDIETSTGKNAKNQLKWEQNVSLRLDSLKLY